MNSNMKQKMYNGIEELEDKNDFNLIKNLRNMTIFSLSEEIKQKYKLKEILDVSEEINNKIEKKMKVKKKK